MSTCQQVAGRQPDGKKSLTPQPFFVPKVSWLVTQKTTVRVFDLDPCVKFHSLIVRQKIVLVAKPKKDNNRCKMRQKQANNATPKN